jgi:DNA repair exonuclease SbcCD ATPase subunit
MRLILQRIRFKNFFSFGNEWTEIILNESSTTLIIGKNGSGKSSAILDAISFALFNKPFRKINKPQLTNSINKKNCMVELDFIANGWQFNIRRGLNPAVFQIIRDGELVTETPDHRDYQDNFEKHILRVNHKTFCQIVMLGSAIFTPFMGLPAAARRSVIEDLLDLQIFSIMNTLLKGRIDGVDDVVKEKTHEKNLVAERLRLTEEHIQQMQASRDEEIENLTFRFLDNEYQIKALFNKASDIHENYDSLNKSLVVESKINKRHATIIKLKDQLAYKIEQGYNFITFLQTHDRCPTCTQIIVGEFQEEKVNEKDVQITEYDAAVDKLDQELIKVKEKMSALKHIHEAIHQCESELREINIRRELYTKENVQLNDEIYKLKAKSESIDISKLDDVKQTLQTIETELNDLNTDRMMMGCAVTMLKDSGIKAKIIKTFMPVINQLINKYLAALDFFVEFNLNEEIEETLKSRYRDEFSYESFSEGEKMRLNIAILFAWRALAKLRGSIDCNLVILDELLDGSLDTEGLDDTLKLISNLTSGENVFVISHKIDQLSDKFSRVIHFEKVRNFSRMAA